MGTHGIQQQYNLTGNASYAVGTLLTMDPLDISNMHIYPALLLISLAYSIILVCNFLVLISIALDRKLHKPMFILLFNLPISDLIGATALFPQLLLSIVSKSRSITYPACFTQALLIHLYGTANLLVLSAMAYDRYIAICFPLRYNSIMIQNKLILIICLIWLTDLTFIGLLLGLVSRQTICRTKIVDMYCNNPSLVKLVCEDTSVNNYYGLFITALFQGGSFMIVIFTYVQIFITCWLNKKSDARMKAIQTCGTHLVVFLFLQFNTALTVIAHRFQKVSPNLRRALGVSIIVFPPILDPLVYGLKTKELRNNIKLLFKSKI